MPNEKKFDAFLSHNSKDKPAVEQIARWLTEKAKLSVWLDKWNLVPGDAWQEELEKALDNSRCCVVFLGENDLGVWQNEELRTALDDRVSEKSIRIVPVLLPKARRPEKESGIPKFLRRLTWVAFQEHVQEEDALKLLVCGIKGEAPGDTGHKIWTGICPFRGLEIFREQDARFFFGRDNIVQQLLNHLETHRLLAVIGPSGSGKSSVVHAGLIPALKNSYLKKQSGSDQATLPIRIAIFTPKEHPLEELAFAIQRLDDSNVHLPDDNIIQQLEAQEKNLGHLARKISEYTHSQRILPIFQQFEKLLAELAGAMEWTDEPVTQLPTEGIIKRLKDQEKSLYYIAREVGAHTGAERIVLVIDQFEELFTQIMNEDERRQFLALMVAALEAPHSPLMIILTMRSDFLGKCAGFPDFNSFVIENLFQIGPLEPENLRQAIEDPAKLAGLQFEEGLVERILKDTGGAPGELPLIEHALLELYQRRNGNQLTQKAYEEIGGIEGALAKRAEDEFTQMSCEEQEILRKMFVLRLIQPGEGAEDTRRRATKEELLATGADDELAERIITRWVDARLLSTANDPQRNTEIIDVAHEALIRKWPNVQEWLKDERENTRFLGQLRQAADEWRQNGQNPDYLYRGSIMVKAEEFLKKYAEDLTEIEREFIQAGITLRDREEREREERRQRELKAAKELALTQAKAVRQLRFIAITMIAGLFAISFLGLGLNNALKEANSQLVNNYWENGRQAGASGDPLLALHYMAYAIKVAREQNLRDTVAQDVVAWMPKWRLMKEFTCNGQVNNAVFSADDTKILTLSEPDPTVISTVELWDASEKKPSKSRIVKKFENSRIIFSEDGTKILSRNYNLGGTVNSVQLFATTTGENIGSIQMPKGSIINNVTFSKDGTKILTWSGDTFRIWEVSSMSRPIRTFQSDDRFGVNGVDFSNDGTKILTWDSSCVIQWNIYTGMPTKLSLDFAGYLKGAAFSKDDKKILTWRSEGVQLWDVSGSKPNPILTFPGKSQGAVISKDATKIITWGYDKVAWILDAFSDGSLLIPEGEFSGAVFSKDGAKVLTWSDDNTVRLWGTSMDRRIEPIRDVLAFSKDGAKFLTWSNNTIQLLNASTVEPIWSLEHVGEVNRAKFFKDDTKILARDNDNIIHLWDVFTGKQIKTVPVPTSKVIRDVTFSKDEKKILTWDGENVQLWDVSMDRQADPNLSIKCDGKVFSDDGSKFLTWSSNTAQLWNTSTGEKVKSFELDGDLSGAVFSKNNSKILTWGNTAWLWNASTGGQIRSFEHVGNINRAILSEDETKILTWDDKAAQLWDVTTGDPIGPSFTKGNLKGAVFSKDEKRILTWDDYNTANLWDVSTGNQIGPTLISERERFITKTVFSKDEKKILFQLGDNTVQLSDAPGDLDYPQDKFVLQVEALTGTKFNLDTRKITVIPPDELYKIQKEWISLAREHAKTCKYKGQNVYLRFFPEGK